MKITLPKDCEKFRMDYETGYKHGYEACKKEIEDSSINNDAFFDFMQIRSDTTLSVSDWSGWSTCTPIAEDKLSFALEDVKQRLNKDVDKDSPTAEYSYTINSGSLQYDVVVKYVSSSQGREMSATKLEITSEYLEDATEKDIRERIYKAFAQSALGRF